MAPFMLGDMLKERGEFKATPLCIKSPPPVNPPPPPATPIGDDVIEDNFLTSKPVIFRRLCLLERWWVGLLDSEGVPNMALTEARPMSDMALKILLKDPVESVSVLLASENREGCFRIISSLNLKIVQCTYIYIR